VIQVREDERKATIYGILPRKSKFSRKMPGGTTEEQIVATNIDIVMLVSGLDNDFNLRRIERYITTAQASGADAVIVLNKADLCERIEQRLREVEQIAHGAPVVLISAMQDGNLEVLHPFIGEGRTLAFLGSSGVGKSTIINRLLGRELQEVQAVRAGDSRGRHTTTRRELLLLPTGGLIIDTPGMRELQLWVNEEQLHSTFEDIQALTQQCHFSNCQHSGEIGCALKAALENGTLDSDRLDNYNKMQKELAHLSEKQDSRAAKMKKERVKKITQQFNRSQKHR
jgi:ribosome biogenesis GTPase